MVKMSETWLSPPYLCKGSQCFYFPVKWRGKIYNLIYSALTVEERDILEQQELTTAGRFPCRFPGYNKSFKYNAKTRKKPELSNMEKTRKAQKPDCLHHIFAKVVDAFVFLLCQLRQWASWMEPNCKPTVVHKAPTSHLMKTRSTGTTA